MTRKMYIETLETTVNLVELEVDLYDDENPEDLFKLARENPDAFVASYGAMAVNDKVLRVLTMEPITYKVTT